ncbi:MAG: asparagine synthase-related protein [Gemmataceae bacterium]|nr:asparagine synthase-related protein [Gemmataceae bacterium]MCI0743372.1 asparagine synthase-related protein [Gemmataceae bacterium]
MKHHEWYVEHRHVGRFHDYALARMSLGFVNKAVQPASNETGALLAVMEGEVYNYEEERRVLKAAGHVFRTDSHAELLLHGFEQEGQAFFRRLHGMFVAAVWDVPNRRLMLINDRFGMKPLYYTELPGRLLFASEIKALLVDPEVSRRPHLRGLSQFFVYGQLLGEDTMLEAIRLLPAASWLTYEARGGRILLEKYWHHEPQSQNVDVDETDFLDQIDDAFCRAVDRRTQGTARLGLSLSGGLDARTILALVNREKPLSTVTLGVQGSLDHKSAAQLARLAGRPHHRYVLNTAFLDCFEEHLTRMVHLTDGHYLSQCIVMPTLPIYRDLGIEVLLRGHAGELMHMDKAYAFSLDEAALQMRDDAALETWLARRLRAHMLDDLAEPLFAPEYHKHIEELAAQSLRDSLRDSQGVGPPVQRVWHLFVSERLRRETALSMMKFGSQVDTRLPYMDNDLVDLLLAAPPTIKLAENIQAHIMRRRMPAFLDVVNANNGARLGAGRFAKRFAELKLKVFAKVGVPGYQPYERLGLWLRRELRTYVEKTLLDPRCLERGIFNPNAVQSVVRRHLNKEANHTFLLMALLIFETGQREFIDGVAVPRGSSYVAPATKI